MSADTIRTPAHDWVPREGVEYCRVCGMVRWVAHQRRHIGTLLFGGRGGADAP